MQQVRVTARRKYTTEEKVRIVVEGFRREVAVRDHVEPGWKHLGIALPVPDIMLDSI
jgi:hypothetical protein